MGVKFAGHWHHSFGVIWHWPPKMVQDESALKWALSFLQRYQMAGCHLGRNP
jgi:hypothetical protein